MATIRRFEEIEAWQLGRELVQAVYLAARIGEFAKDRGFKDQIQRAAVSICSNIAEGFERCGNKEFSHFLWIAKGSAGEVASQLYHAKDLQYITESDYDSMRALTVEIRSKIHNLIQSLSKPRTGSRF